MTEIKEVIEPLVTGQQENGNAIQSQCREEIDKFIFGLQRWYKNYKGVYLEEDTVVATRTLILDWNKYLQDVEGQQDVPVNISLEVQKCMRDFTACHHYDGLPEVIVHRCLLEWNWFLLSRQGEPPVSKIGPYVTLLSLIFYMVDMGSDVGTAIYYGRNGKWWQCGVTLLVVYTAVAISTVWKLVTGSIRWNGPLSTIQYIGSLLVNWPDFQQCWRLLQLERKLCTSPEHYAYLVPELQQARRNVALLKFTEGLWESCPQAILQLCLLIPELNGDMTLAGSFRIASTILSLCSAGAALANQERYCKLRDNYEITLRDIIMLLLCAVPATVSRLLSVALLLTVNVYGGLAFVIMHVILNCVFLGTTKRFPNTKNQVLLECLAVLKFLLSPFNVVDSIAHLLIRYAIHFLCNTSVTVVWAVNTLLVIAHPVLFAAIIIFNFIFFVIGLVSGILYKKYYPQ